MKIKFQGRDVEATVIDFLTRREDFNEYQLLTDDKTLKIKLVVTRILRIEGEKNPDGSPVYHIAATNVVAPLD